MVSSKEIHELAINTGWWNDQRPLSTMTCLIHSEVSEALEEYRQNKMNIYYADEKPEGFGIELADIVIRIKDFQEAIFSEKEYFDHIDHITDQLAEIHKQIALSLHAGNKISANSMLNSIIESVDYLARTLDINLDECIKIKHEYNKTRPYRHGNKKC